MNDRLDMIAPSAEERTQKVSKRYLEEQGSAYHEGRPRERVLDPRRRAVKAEYIQNVLAPWLPSQVDRILEFGAGFGQNLLNLPGKVKIAYEPSEYARKIASQYQDIEVIESLDGLDQYSFDLVLSNHSLEHTLEPRNELIRLRKLLKPNGIFLCIVPYEKDLSYREGDMNAHLYSWTRMTLGNLMHESGFKVEATANVYRSMEFRLSPIRHVSPRLWFALSKAAGYLLRNKDVFVVATPIR